MKSLLRVVVPLNCQRLQLHVMCVSDTAKTMGVATSMTLSAISANCSSSIEVSAGARTIWMLASRLCGKRWQRKELASSLPSLFSRSCRMRLNGRVGFLSPNSSPVISCWSFRCLNVAVHLMSFVISVSYGWSAGGFKSRSLTSVANFGAEGANHVVKLSLLSGDASCGKLHLHLCKPDFRVCWPERR